MASDPEAQIKIQNIAGTIVHCTVTDTAGTVQEASYNTNPVIASLGLHGANEKLYKVEYYTTGEGYKPTSPQIKYYKVLKYHKVTFNANTGTFTDGTQPHTVLVPHNTAVPAPSGGDKPTKTGYHADNWYTDTTYATQWDFTTQITEDKQLYPKWEPNTDTSYTVKHFKQNVTGSGYTEDPGSLENLQGTTGEDPIVTPKAYTGFKPGTYTSVKIAGDGSTVVEVKYDRKVFEVSFTANGGTPEPPRQNVRYEGRATTPTTQPLKSNSIFDGWYSTYALTGSPWDFASNTVTGPTTLYAKWKPLHQVSFSVDGGNGTLSAKPEGGNETSSGATSVSVVDGKSVTFTAKPKFGYEVDSWTISPSLSFESGTGGTGQPTAKLNNVTSDSIIVKVKFKPKTTVKGSDNNAWALLKKVVELAPANSTIYIEGEIEATDGDNSGEITINKKIIIRGKSSRGTLNAQNKSRIFNVTNGGELELIQVNLKNGRVVLDNGGGINAAADAVVRLDFCTIEACSAKNGGGIYMAVGSTVYIGHKVTITGNTASEYGGGVYINESYLKRFIMKASQSCITVDSSKNDVYLNNNSKIYLEHGFTAPTDNSKVARITVPNAAYSLGTKVISIGVFPQAPCAKAFTVTPKAGSTETWYIKSDCYLTTTNPFP